MYHFVGFYGVWYVLSCDTSTFRTFCSGTYHQVIFRAEVFFYKGLHTVTCSFIFQRISKASFFCSVQISDIQYLITRKNIIESSTYKLEGKVLKITLAIIAIATLFLRLAQLFQGYYYAFKN